MILSCIARVKQRFGIGHVVDVLHGSENDRVFSLNHHELSTYGLMKAISKKHLTNMVYQLTDQGLLSRTEGDYPVLILNDKSLEILRGQRKVWLLPSRTKKVKKSSLEKDSWEGVHHGLFDDLRELRTDLARDRNVPPYIIFSDATLRDLARHQPKNAEEFLSVHGVGEKKLADFGERFMERISKFEGQGTKEETKEEDKI